MHNTHPTFDLGTDGLTDMDPAVVEWTKVYAGVTSQE